MYILYIIIVFLYNVFFVTHFLLRVHVASYVVIIHDSALRLILIPPPPIDADTLTTHFFGHCDDPPDSDVSLPISRAAFLIPGVASDDDT